MKYGLLMVAALVAGCSTSPSQMHQVATQELCVDYAQAVLTGQPVATGFLGLLTAPAMESELQSRGESCSPNETYIQMAEERIQLANKKQQATMQALGTAAQIEQASRPYTLPNTLHNSTTTCGWNGPQWQCQSTGN